MTDMWNPFELVRSVFDAQSLERANEEAVRYLKIPDSSKLFLTTVGLPQGILLFEFALQGRSIPTIQEFAHAQGVELTVPKGLRRIGTDEMWQICLSEQDESGHVVAFDMEQGLGTRYVNRSIETLGGFFAMMYGHSVDSLSDDEHSRFARDLEAQMRDLDPRAFEVEHHWALITEQMKDGLL